MVCREAFLESDLIHYAGRTICTPCAERQKMPSRAPTPGRGTPAAIAPAKSGLAPGSAAPAGAPASAKPGPIDKKNPPAGFGRELFRCLAADDLEGFRALFLTPEEAVLAFDRAATDHATLVRARIERDFRSKRALYFKEGPFEFLDFALGPIEEGDREVQRYGRSTLRFKAAGVERRITIQRVYRVRGAFRLEFFE